MTSRLTRRIAFTLGALFVYRLGTYIPVPGVDLTAWGELMRGQPGGVLAQANLLSGGAIGRLSIFSISIVPYLTAAMFVQLAVMVSRRLRAIRDEGERGRQRIERTTRVVTVVLAAFQAYGIAGGLQRVSGVVIEPGALFMLTTVLTLTGGVLFLIWLCGQMTAHGIGNGLSLILFVGIATQLPQQIGNTIEFARMGVISPAAALGFIALAIAVVASIVAMERARRQLPVRFAERDIGGRKLAAQSLEIAYKLNPAGIMPVSIGGLLLVVVLAAISIALLILGNNSVGPFVGPIVSAISPGQPGYIAITAVVTVFFVFVYTAFVCDPTSAAKTLELHGGVIADVAPGEPTAEHLDGVLTRTAAIGACYLVVVMQLADVLSLFSAATPPFIGGPSALLLVCATLDIEAQVRDELAQPVPA